MIDLEKVAKGIRKEFGSVKVASNIEDPKDFVSTGNLAFDLILDGGIPFGYVTEFMGFSQSGKSLFMQQTIGNAMSKFDAVGILIDRENAYTKKRGEQLGIDNDKLIIAKPADVPTPFHAFSFLIQTVEAIREQDKDVYISAGIDSISAFGKDVDLDKSDSGRKAKSIHEGLREALTIIDNRVMLLIANQFTYKIGVMYGDPRTTTAGESIKYYGNIRLALEDRKEIIDPNRGNEVMGNWIGVEVVKTRLGPCHRECYLQHLYESGIDYHSGYARLLVNRGYLRAKNKKEFHGFKQTTVQHGEGDEKKYYNELKVEKLIEDHPELLFSEYPTYNMEKKDVDKSGV
jgi:RecA/RadA recombinase